MHDADPEAYIAEKGLMMVTDNKVVAEVVNSVITDNRDAVANYRAGKNKAFGFLMGRVMKTLGGTGNPDIARKALQDALDK